MWLGGIDERRTSDVYQGNEYSSRVTGIIAQMVTSTLLVTAGGGGR